MSKIRLTGVMTCAPEQAQAVRDALPAHIDLTRQEPGCLEFHVEETEPGVFRVAELFRDRAAFDAHQARASATDWARVTAGFPRDYKIEEI